MRMSVMVDIAEMRMSRLRLRAARILYIEGSLICSVDRKLAYKNDCMHARQAHTIVYAELVRLAPSIRSVELLCSPPIRRMSGQVGQDRFVPARNLVSLLSLLLPALNTLTRPVVTVVMYRYVSAHRHTLPLN